MSLTKAHQQEVQEVLTDFGLSKNDQSVYLALLRLGQTSLTPLSKETSLPLTTVQSIMKRLVDLGIVDVSKQKTRSRYEAADPRIFKDLLVRKAQDMAGIIPLLQTLQTDPASTPKVRVYTRERITDILHASLQCSSKQVYELVSARDFQEVLGEKFHYTRRRIKQQIQLKSLRVQEHEIKKYNALIHTRELREAKFLPPEMTFRTSILFWDDTVALLTTKPEGVHLTIESRRLREMFQQIFEMLWSVSRKMETLVEPVKT